MGLRIKQNIAAMNAYRNLSVTDGQLAKSLEKLSSGFQINRAADDALPAAGLGTSEGLRAQVAALTVAVRNDQDGISVVQTAEGAMNEVHPILDRMRDLAAQAVATENLSASESRIRDTDIAQEMVPFARSQILTPAGTAMLAQANQAPQQVGPLTATFGARAAATVQRMAENEATLEQEKAGIARELIGLAAARTAASSATPNMPWFLDPLA